MGFLLRTRLSSFFAGAATVSAVGFYLLYKDYMLAHDATSQKEEMENAYIAKLQQSKNSFKWYKIMSLHNFDKGRMQRYYYV